MEKQTQDREEKGTVMSWVQTIVLALVLAFLIKTFIFNTTLVQGTSMEPTLHEEDRMICLVFPYYFSDPDYGDIVILDPPNGSNDKYVKRVVGQPGDKIEIRDGQVTRNGLPLEEDYTHPRIDTLAGYQDVWVLGEDEFFVLGDNRHPGASTDSRAFGPVEKSQINSKAFLRYYPFSKIERF